MTSASLSTLRELRLADMAAAYEAILAQPLDQQPDGHEIVARLVDAERQGRAHRRTQLNLRLSKLRYAATLQDIDCSPARNLTSNQLAVLTDPAWMGRGENVLTPELPAAVNRTWPARWATTLAPWANEPCTTT